MCREVPEEFLRPESGWAIGAMSFSATGILVGIPYILRKINFLKFRDLKSFDRTLKCNNRILSLSCTSYATAVYISIYISYVFFCRKKKTGDVICLRRFPQAQRYARRTRVWTGAVLRSPLGNSTLLPRHIHSDIQTHAHCLRHPKVKKKRKKIHESFRVYSTSSGGTALISLSLPDYYGLVGKLHFSRTINAVREWQFFTSFTWFKNLITSQLIFLLSF